MSLRVGILGCSRFAIGTFGPAINRADGVMLRAVASRNADRARQAADGLGAPVAFGSYEALIADPAVDIVYVPLPNHLHVEWTLKAIEAGKHVLCEKPLAPTVHDVTRLIAARDTHGVTVAEGFMVFSAPHWIAAKAETRKSGFGTLRAFTFHTSYLNEDRDDIRNSKAAGGGAMSFIGCYPVALALWLFEAMPIEVSAFIEVDPVFGTDRQVSAILRFQTGQASFLVSNRMTTYQRAQLFGDAARVDVMVPCTPPDGFHALLRVDDGSRFADMSAREFLFPGHDQYRAEIEAFAKAVIRGRPLPFPLEHSAKAVRVGEAIMRAAAEGRSLSP